MEKEQYRSMTRFLFLEAKSCSEIKKRLDALYDDSSPSMATVKNWFNEIQRGRTSVFDEPRPGAPKTATTEDNVTKINDLVLADRRLKIRKIAETVGISKDRVAHILHEILGMRKLPARWMPRLLTPDNKRSREITSKQCLTLFKRNPKEFLRRFVTVDETWIYWYTPQSKEQSKQWTSHGEPAPKKATVPSAGKVMATVF
ncbi:protein GVQW3-like [Drosophila suzukii]|uniref:Protein GVQW3-like n=1 Tax=Drosophila suzukii TaxID=28584 RepID=A0ABM4TXJ7_DROSZ